MPILAAGIVARTWGLLNPGLVNIGEPAMYVSDEGIVGLMGKHILEGRSRPLFFYGQSYLGALEAYLVAGSEALFGVTLLAVRAVPYATSLVVVALAWWAASVLFGRFAAPVATALMAVPSVYVLEWGLKARGGFIEHVALSLLLLGLFARFVYRNVESPGTRIALGLVAGLALWVNQLVGTTIAVMLLVLWRRHLWTRRLTTVGVALAIGALPLLAGVAPHPTAMPSTLARKFFLMNRVRGPERFADDRVVWGARQRLAALADGPQNVALVMGWPAPASARTRLPALLGIAPIMLFVLSVAHCARRARVDGWTGPHGLVLLLLAGVVAVGYHSARYMLVAYPLASVMAGSWWAHTSGWQKRLAAAAIAAALLVNGALLVERAGASPTEHTSALVKTLRTLGCTRAYSAGPIYHIVFNTRERVIIAPLQKDRIPAYDGIVAAAEHVCYVYRDDQERKRQHKRFLQALRAARVSYAKASSPPYFVLHDFTPRARITPALIEEARRR